MAGSYFKEHGCKIQYVLDEEVDDGYGLRRPQWRALQSIGSHFELAEDGEATDPALVVMPTGSGKTAVLKLAAFQERAKRVLIVTPSQIVRDQIASRFGDLETLRKLNVFPEGEEFPAPDVKEQKGMIETEEVWEGLREFDVVIGTPRSMSPAMKDVAEPPDDLFDLILVDEAHHKPATTWSKLLKSFSKAKQISFTATPFRRDEERIDGQVVFHYKISQALRDGIFSPIHFEEANVSGINSDLAIAQKAEEIFQRDREEGLTHYLMARAQSKNRAKELKEVYDTNTDLSLRVINSDHAYSRVGRSIDDLENGDLDGVICVDMLGEGFDFPRLKIAAVHDPQKSLPVILQFIGRFARETDEETGEATFVGSRSDIEVESTHLFNSSESWAELIPSLSEERVQERMREQEFLERFEILESRVKEVDYVSPGSLTPYKSVKIYRTDGEVDLASTLDLPDDYDLMHRHVDSEDPTVTFFLTRSDEVVQWSRSTEPRDIEHDLFVVYHDAETDLLFINASSKSSKMYRSIVDSITLGDYKPLPMYELKRVLNGIENTTFYNIGMRSRIQHTSTESYRTMAGPRTDRALDPSDSRLFHQGHVFGGGERDDEAVTIGYSSGAKVWSTSYVSIMDLVNWCEDLARLVSQNSDLNTGTNLDSLPTGTQIDQLPDRIIGVDWHNKVYHRPPEVETVVDGDTRTTSALNLDLDACPSENHIAVDVIGPDWTHRLHYSPFDPPYFVSQDGQPDVRVNSGPSLDADPLADYLNDHPLSFFTPQFTRLEGEEEHEAPKPEELIPEDRYICVDWQEEDVNIELEFTDEDPSHSGGFTGSIHGYLVQELPKNHDIVFYDHTKGEIADLVAFDEDPVVCTLYHCKKAGNDFASARDGDIFEICGQAIKCLSYVGEIEKICEHIKDRQDLDRPDYIQGNNDDLDSLKDTATEQSFQFRVVLVQPGISQSELAKVEHQDKASQLASCDRYLRSAGAQEVRIMASA